MKKFLVSMMAVITAVLLVACSNASNKDLVHVGVLQYVEHPSGEYAEYALITCGLAHEIVWIIWKVELGINRFDFLFDCRILSNNGIRCRSPPSGISKEKRNQNTGG